MKNTNTLLNELVNNHYNNKQKEKVSKLPEYETDRFVLTYSTLAIGIEDDLVYGGSQVIKDFYEIDDLSLLSKVDILIAKIIITLTNLTGIDVKKGYETEMTLDRSQPEVKYLINVMEKLFNK